MIAIHLMLWSAWVLYSFLHSALATSGTKTLVTKRLLWKDSTYRIVYNLLAVLGLLALLYAQFSIKSSVLFDKTFVINILAGCISFVGITIMVACIIKYFKQLSGTQGEKTRDVLEVNGLHQFVRHPLYLGTFIFLTGLFFFFPMLKNLGTVIIIIIYTLIGIRFEEQKLVARFGEAYKEYQQKVAKIIPGIK